MKQIAATLNCLAVLTMAYPATWSQLGLSINGSEAEAQAGYAISLSRDGMTLAVGSPAFPGTVNGRVRVYRKFNGQWSQVGAILREGRGLFGSAVSLSADGGVLAVGAPLDGSFFAGRVYVYRISGGIWERIGNPISGFDGDAFGASVSLSGDGTFLGVGAWGVDRNGANSGAARIYQYQSGSWIKIGSDLNGEAEQDNAGESVSLSADGRFIAVGARLNDGGGLTSGHARVFQRIGSTWLQIGGDIDGNQFEQSGSSVSLSADGAALAIASVRNTNTSGEPGAERRVRIFRNVSNSWVQSGNDIAGESGQNGVGEDDFVLGENDTVSLSAVGSIVAVGARGYDGNGLNSGRVRVFWNLKGEWIQLGQDLVGAAAGDDFGGSISLADNGMILAVGAAGADANGANSGQVKVFKLSFNATEAPSIIKPEWSESGQFKAVLLGQPQTAYRIQWSNNLTDWRDFASFVSESETTLFEDAGFDAKGIRFYRATSP